jgi:hypothetical protein
MQACAISAGVTGRDGLCSRVGKLPVTAQLMMVGFMSVWDVWSQDCREPDPSLVRQSRDYDRYVRIEAWGKEVYGGRKERPDPVPSSYLTAATLS